MLTKFILSLMLISPLSVFAAASQGETLERQRWEYVKNKNWTAVESMIAPYFQLAFYDGARNKDQYVIMAKTANIQDYTLSNFNVTEGPNTSIVTYDISLAETVEGKRITSKATRLSVWENNNNKWLLIAHSILIPVPSPSGQRN